MGESRGSTERIRLVAGSTPAINWGPNRPELRPFERQATGRGLGREGERRSPGPVSRT
jgi:hypothetical protein